MRVVVVGGADARYRPAVAASGRGAPFSMFVIFRWWYFAGVTGVGLFAHGAVESHLAWRAGSEPVAITIEDLTNGKPLARPWVELGRHVALEPLGVTWRARKSKKALALYPLVEVEAPIVAALASGTTKAKSGLPGFDACHVFALRGGVSLAKVPRDVESTRGVVFAFDELSSSEQNLVTLAVPNVDRAAVRVLEIDRRPGSLAMAVGELFVGNVLLWLAIRLFRNQSAKKAAAEAQQPQPS